MEVPALAQVPDYPAPYLPPIVVAAAAAAGPVEPAVAAGQQRQPYAVDHVVFQSSMA